jgi:hypothetical protein
MHAVKDQVNPGPMRRGSQRMHAFEDKGESRANEERITEDACS